MLEYKKTTQKEMTDTSGFSVRVLGVGGAGANALDRIALEGMEEADLVIMNTDERALSTSVCSKKIQLGADLTKGLGAGGDPDLGHEAALEAAEEIREQVKGQSVVFLCVGLGGGTGSGAAPVAARIARQEGAFVVVFATMPFSFEGRRRLEQANQSLDRLRADANALLVFENDRMGELILPKEGIQKAFAAADKVISQSVRAITQLVTRPGLIRIGLDDLLSALRNNDARCLFGVGAAKGSNRAQGALKKALKSPLLDEGNLLNRARNVMVHISGGESLTLFESETLMNDLLKHVRDDAQVFFGTSIDQSMGDELSVTIISSLQAAAMAPASGSDDDDESDLGEEDGEEDDGEAEQKPDHSPADIPEATEPVEAVAPVEVAEKEQNGVVEEAKEHTVEVYKDLEVAVEEKREEEIPPANQWQAPPERVVAAEGMAQDDGNKTGLEGAIPVTSAAKPEEEVDGSADDVAGDVAKESSGGKGAQTELELDPGAKGRFEKSEPTIVDGEDLDVPAFLRKGK
ncbi:MAG: cell division protein FtsZ [Verrucomicrobiota bacterium]